jgi:hypothetical protein
MLSDPSSFYQNIKGMSEWDESYAWADGFTYKIIAPGFDVVQVLFGFLGKSKSKEGIDRE